MKKSTPPTTRKRYRSTTSALATVAIAMATSAAAQDLAASPGVRPIGGRGNNAAHPDWGTPNAQLVRGSSGIHYGDGISSLAGASRPGARELSNAFFTQTGSVPNNAGISDYIWTWGQFLDHDLSLTEGTAEFAPIPVPTGDVFFDPGSTGTQIIPFRRGMFDSDTGVDSPRAQINEIAGYIDGSNVYGSTADRAAWLRTFSNGRLKVTSSSVGDLLPFNDGTVPNAGSPEKADLSTDLFVAGDIRVNEQPTLACMHTLFVREHNRLAAQIAQRTPGLSDEEIYQRARRIVIAEIQHITIDEFLPTIVGSSALGAYTGYDGTANPGVSAAFATAAFRLGHTLLSPQILRLNEDGSPISSGPLSLRDSFFAVVPQLLGTSGIEPFLRGVAAQTSQDLDDKVIDDVRNFLFGAPGQGGLDLIALNIQRGRDLGLPDFNTLRTEYGLPRKTSFTDITSDAVNAAKLSQLYGGDINNIDAFVGLFVEDDVSGAIVGETMRAVLLDQFRRSRAGDRFWYERYLSQDELVQVQKTLLSDVIKRNTPIQRIQKNVFYVKTSAAAGGDSN